MLAQFAMAFLLAATPERQLLAAKPGARIVIAPGEYAGFHLSAVRGLRGQPIVVVAKGAVVKGGVHLSDVAYLEIEGLVIEGAPARTGSTSTTAARSRRRRTTWCCAM